MKHLLLLLTCLASFSFAQVALPPAATWAMEGNKKATIDFEIPTEGISDPSLSLSQFKGKPLVIFYFSSKCPHCMKAYPKLEFATQEFMAKGLNVLAISVSNNSKPSIRTFIENQNVKVPVVKDHRRIFSKRYGTGRVPVVYLVNAQGEYIRYRHFDNEINDLKIELGKLFDNI